MGLFIWPKSLYLLTYLFKPTITTFVSAKKKQEILDLSANQHFRLIAISSSLSLNKILWSINSNCGLKLTKNAELEKLIQVPIFTDKISKPQTQISLIPNKLENGLLVKQLANIDFIVEINGIIPESEFKQTIQCIKKIDGVMAAIETLPSSIKRKDPFCPE